MKNTKEQREPNEGRFTPGPFVVDTYLDANGNYTVRPDDGSATGDTDAEPIATVYRLADARLIAAAPELLEKLKMLHGGTHGYPLTTLPRQCHYCDTIERAEGREG